MTLQNLKNLYKNELASIYDEREISGLVAIFAQEILGLSRIEQRQATNIFLTDEQKEAFNQVLIQLKNGKPFQQIFGKTEFYGLDFLVTEDVLVPRPETEELLELAVEKIKTIQIQEGTPIKILDIGTGSGVIAIVLKKYFPKAEVSAIDFSEKALAVAKSNAAQHQVEINFVHADYLHTELTEVFDVMISNPPYIGQNEKREIADSVKIFEPEMALFAPAHNALVFYEKMAADCETNLAVDGMIFLEINQKHGSETRNLFTEVLSEVRLLKDISRNDRFVWGEK